MPAAPSIALTKVDSTQIDSIGHDPATQTLAIRFKNRSTGAPTSLYHYSNFTAEDFAAFEAAESKGSHFGKHIKVFDKKYPYTKIEDRPAEQQAA
ncbi:KTSC domain-containing protein [Trinickia mobilis]|uniref:KTSC domain-containing protein n=1 Tax=Trinickia mobilis TaxID=2816356 RepID=UPI001A8D3E2D|nr:KTSC domain-containing protein [Trinickia mobilis]